jgi:hypothetical protein
LVDLRPSTGVNQFGPDYRVMFENDAHAPGSADRVLLERMVRLCSETADYLYRDHTPLDIRYRPGSRPQLDALVDRMLLMPWRWRSERLVAAACQNRHSLRGEGRGGHAVSRGTPLLVTRVTQVFRPNQPAQELEGWQ